jgi:hypothetical protein
MMPFFLHAGPESRIFGSANPETILSLRGPSPVIGDLDRHG